MEVAELSLIFLDLPIGYHFQHRYLLIIPLAMQLVLNPLGLNSRPPNGLEILLAQLGIFLLICIVYTDQPNPLLRPIGANFTTGRIIPMVTVILYT